MEFNKEDLYTLEASLRNYFLREKSRFIKNNENYLLMKYRGLSLGLDDSNPRNVIFIVSIATLEAQFEVRTGHKVYGSLGGDERIVQQWYQLGGVQQSMVDITNRNKRKKKVNKQKENELNLDKKSIFPNK